MSRRLIQAATHLAIDVWKQNLIDFRLNLMKGCLRDAVIKSVAKPEANQLHQSANRRTNNDMCSVKTSYLTNQEEFFHETNFHAF